MKDFTFRGRTFPTYGAKSVWTFVKLRGKVLPVTGFTDQYHVRFPDGTQLFVEPWDCDSAFESLRDHFMKRDKKAIKEREMKRLREGFQRNAASTSIEVDLAFERNSGKFVEDMC